MFFFFQAEDGIRDIGVTGVQTCALPICATGGAVGFALLAAVTLDGIPENLALGVSLVGDGGSLVLLVAIFFSNLPESLVEIGRASCRESVEISVVAGSFKKKKDAKYVIC